MRQIDVARATGIDQKTLSNYETGKTSPDSYSIIKLAEFFQVTTDYLLGYSSLNIKTGKDVTDLLERIEKDLLELKNTLRK